MQLPAQGDVYFHPRTETYYVVEDCRMFKLNGRWRLPGIVNYTELVEPKEKYARLVEDFVKAFIKTNDVPA